MEGGAVLDADPPAPDGGLGAWVPGNAAYLAPMSPHLHLAWPFQPRPVSWRPSLGSYRTNVTESQLSPVDSAGWGPLMSPADGTGPAFGGDVSFPVGRPQLRLLAEGGLVTRERGSG